MSRNNNNRNNNRRRSQRSPKQGNPNKISDHFSKRDFVCHCGECSDKLRISLGLVGGLEMLRAIIGKRINVTRAFSCPESADKASKIRRNFYSTGVAADLCVDDMDARDIFIAAEEVPEFMGIGLNLDDNTVSVDTRKADERVLWVEKNKRVIDLTPDNRAMYLDRPQPDS